MLPYQLSIQTDQGIDHSEEGDHSKNHAKTLYDFPHRHNSHPRVPLPTLVHHPPESSPYLDAIT